MPGHANDRNLLFGILAQQMDFISRDALIDALHFWVQHKHRTLGDILLERQALRPDTHALLEALVDRHLALHDNDAGKSLAALSSAASLQRDLGQVADPDVQASLAHVTAGPGRPQEASTILGQSVGDETSRGRRFRILRPHARGGLGEVFVARDEELNREVALKEIQDRHADRPEHRTRFLLEAEITGGLEHPGIVPVYGLGTYADGRPFYAMRFIRGDSLKDVIARFHRDAPGRARRAYTLELRGLLGRFIDVCQAIQYAHDRGVLHRDLKPGNIMLGKYGETLVVDWGLAKPQGVKETRAGEPVLQPASASGSVETMAGSALGTPAYMSPEQAAGRLDQLGPASDIYSLGATLYALLTGQAPVEDSAVTEQRRADLGKVLHKVQRGDIPRPRQVKPDIDPALEAICLKAMALNPADRYAAPRALADDLEHWLADEPVGAWREPWTARVRRWVGRHRTLVTGAAAALLVGVLSLAAVNVLLAQANDVIQAKNDELTRANERIQAQNVAIKQEVVEKEKQRQLAEVRLKQSVEAVGLFADDARVYCEDALVPGDSRKELFLVLIDHLEKQAEQPSVEAAVDAHRIKAWMYHHLARVYSDLLQIEKSRAAVEKGLQATEEWLRLAPKEEHPHARSHRAGLLFLMGNYYAMHGKAKAQQAQDYYRQALAERRELLGQLAVDRFTRGKSITELADSLDAVKEFDESLRLREQAYQQTGNFDHFNNWCWTCYKAVEHAPTYEQKKAYLTKVDVMSAALHRQKPHNRPVLTRWARALRELGDLELDHKKVAEALAAYRQYAVVTRKLATGKDLLLAQQLNARAWYQLARIESLQGKNDDARKHFEHSLVSREQLLLDYPDNAQDAHLKLDKCFSLVGLGRHAESARLAKETTQWLFFDASVQYRLACVYAQSIPAVAEARRPQALTAADEQLQGEYRDLALRHLRHALQRGYQSFFLVRTDADLDPIRGDQRFQEILDEYNKK
jgi:tRNA A-37 threonylcarbamoyl transferase component Bud32